VSLYVWFVLVAFKAKNSSWHKQKRLVIGILELNKMGKGRKKSRNVGGKASLYMKLKHFEFSILLLFSLLSGTSVTYTIDHFFM